MAATAKKRAPIVTPSAVPRGFVPASSLSLTFNEAMGNPEGEDLRRVLAGEKPRSVPSLPSPRQPSSIMAFDSSDSSDDDFEIVSAPSSSGTTASRNYIYGYRFACPYIVTAHFGKNGPWSKKKVYDREFMLTLTESLLQRDRSADGFSNPDLLCNQLNVHAVKNMRDPETGETKADESKKGLAVYHNLFVRVFSKTEVDAGMNTDSEMVLWLQRIRDAFCSTRAKYPFTLSIGRVLGRNKSKSCPLDAVMLDSDVAEYAQMIYGKKIANGKFLNDPDKVAQFFSTKTKAVEMLG